MLPRLVLSLLLALFASGAVARHCEARPIAAMGAQHTAHDLSADAADRHHGHSRPDGTGHAPVAQDMCLGCIPPSTWRGPSVVAPAIKPALPRADRLARFDRIAQGPPALPPPRRG